MKHQFRVWPDCTCQRVSDGDPLPYMSDDFLIVLAVDEEAAIRQYSRWECCTV